MKRVNKILSGSFPEIHSIGISIWDPIHARREHIGSCWEVVHIIRGIVKLHIKAETFRGKPGDTLIVPAKTPHRDEFPLGSEFEVLHVMFKWNDAAALFPGQVNRDLENLPLVDKQSIREMAFEMYDCFRRRRLLWEEMTSACLYRLLLFMRSVTGELRLPAPKSETAAARERHRVMIQKAREFIRNNLGQPIALPDIAAHLEISPYHLSHLFSEESGFTLSSYLVNSRMEKAAQLLADPGVRVSEVAYTLGFKDPNYFCKAFRSHFKCSPGRYQAKLLRARRNLAVSATKHP